MQIFHNIAENPNQYTIHCKEEDGGALRMKFSKVKTARTPKNRKEEDKRSAMMMREEIKSTFSQKLPEEERKFTETMSDSKLKRFSK
jgi:hypothetical protein